MHLATLCAFEDELASIQKEAGLRDVWSKGTIPLQEAAAHLGRKAGVKAENVLDAARKLPVVGKKLKDVNLGHVQEVAQRLMT